MKQNYLDSRSKKVQRHPYNKENMTEESKGNEMRQVADRRNIKMQQKAAKKERKLIQ